MAIPVHTTDLVDGSQFNQTDRVIAGLQLGVANAAGGSNGAVAGVFDIRRSAVAGTAGGPLVARLAPA